MEEEFSGTDRPVVMSITGCSWVLVRGVGGGLNRGLNDVFVQMAKEV
jgi:hypothetical protein